MLSVDVEVSILNGGLEISLVVLLVLIGNLLLNELKLVGVEGAVAHEVSEKADSLADVATEDLHLEGADLSASLGLEAGTHLLNGLVDVALCVAGSAAGQHLLKKVSAAGGLKVLIAGARADENTN